MTLSGSRGSPHPLHKSRGHWDPYLLWSGCRHFTEIKAWPGPEDAQSMYPHLLSQPVSPPCPPVPRFLNTPLPPTRRKAPLSPKTASLMLISHFCPVRTEQYLSLSHPGSSCLPLFQPTALSCRCLLGLNRVECTDPWLFPFRSNPTPSPPLEIQEVAEG